MKNGFITRAMWTLFAPTFRKNLPMLGVTDRKAVMKKARKKYNAILKDIPPFGKSDILLINLISAAEIAAIYLSLDQKPSCEKLKECRVWSVLINPLQTRHGYVILHTFASVRVWVSVCDHGSVCKKDNCV